MDSVSNYRSIDGNKHYFKCRDTDGFQLGTFEQAREWCKNNGLFDDIFDEFPSLTDNLLYTSIWRISQYELANSTYKFFENRNKAKTGFSAKHNFSEIIFKKYGPVIEESIQVISA